MDANEWIFSPNKQTVRTGTETCGRANPTTHPRHDSAKSIVKSHTVLPSLPPRWVWLAVLPTLPSWATMW